MQLNDYRLHELSGDEFENLVVHLCRELLGSAVMNFSEGKDGGRDARFHGTANKYPSQSEPWSGKFVIQAKRTANPIAKCADPEFKKVLEDEFPNIKKLKAAKELEIYLVFTNRKMSAGTDAILKKLIHKETGVKWNDLFGLETITSHLDAHPKVLTACGLDRFKGPLIIHPEELAEVINAFHDNKDVVTNVDDTKFSFEYTDLEAKKNPINGLSAEYFEIIKENSDPYFSDIQKFLINPINVQLAESYYTLADEFKTKITAKRNKFGTFDEVLCYLYDEILFRVPELKPRRRLVNVFLHFMYCNCDIGRRK
jgi:hypothetical protein